MKFIVHSQFDENSIRASLGRPDYGYYFVRKAYQLALMELGSVETVQNPESEVDAIFESCVENGEACVFLSFAPPHKTPINLKCPTIPVIAWGLSNIPDEVWDDEPRNDWRFVLRKLGSAITLSKYAAHAVMAALGPDFPVRAIAAPVAEWPTAGAAGAVRPHSKSAGAELKCRNAVIDSAAIDLSADLLVSVSRPGAGDDERAPEFGHLETNSPRRPAQTEEDISPATVETAAADPAPGPETIVKIGGVVYTAVLDPEDLHKNWIDLVAGFCWAFRETADATLIVKIVQHDIAAYQSKVFELLCRLSPFKCRVIVVQGYLEDAEYEALIAATTFYVNASKCEGTCRPLMEFMAYGRPAIAPAHTAAADYINDNVAFVLRASPEISAWPHDPRELFRTTRYRLDWGSLLVALQESYQIAKHAPEKYAAMAARARTKMQECSSVSAIRQQLTQFLMSPEISPVAATPETPIESAPATALTDVAD